MTVDQRMIKVDEFVNMASRTETILRGYIRFSGEDPSVILYGRDSFRCPRTPIPRDQIEGLQLGQTHRCAGGPTGFSTMWYATIYLKKAETPEGKALEQLLALFLAEENPADATQVCECSEKRAKTVRRTLDECFSVEIRDERACIDTALGELCVPAPGIPDATAGEICLHFCTFGVRARLYVLGNEVGCAKLGRGCNC